MSWSQNARTWAEKTWQLITIAALHGSCMWELISWLLPLHCCRNHFNRIVPLYFWLHVIMDGGLFMYNYVCVSQSEGLTDKVFAIINTQCMVSLCRNLVSLHLLTLQLFCHNYTYEVRRESCVKSYGCAFLIALPPIRHYTVTGRSQGHIEPRSGERACN